MRADATSSIEMKLAGGSSAPGAAASAPPPASPKKEEKWDKIEEHGFKVESSAKEELRTVLTNNEHKGMVARVMNSAVPLRKGEEGSEGRLVKFFGETIQPFENCSALTIENVHAWLSQNGNEFIIAEGGHLQPSLCYMLGLSSVESIGLERAIKSLYAKGVSLVTKQEEQFSGQIQDWMQLFFADSEEHLLIQAAKKFDQDEKSIITVEGTREVRYRFEAGAMFYVGAMHNFLQEQPNLQKRAIAIGEIINKINTDSDKLLRVLESVNKNLDRTVDEKFVETAEDLLREGTKIRLNVIDRPNGVAKITKQLEFVNAINQFIGVCKEVDKTQKFSKDIMASMIKKAKEKLAQEVFNDKVFAEELEQAKKLVKNLAALRQAAFGSHSSGERGMNGVYAIDAYHSGYRLVNELLAKPVSPEKNQELELLAETIHHCAEISKKDAGDISKSLEALENNVNQIAGKPNRWKQFLGAVCVLAGIAAIALGVVFAIPTGGISAIAGAIGGVSLFSTGLTLYHANRRVGFSKRVADLADNATKVAKAKGMFSAKVAPVPSTVSVTVVEPSTSSMKLSPSHHLP